MGKLGRREKRKRLKLLDKVIRKSRGPREWSFRKVRLMVSSALRGKRTAVKESVGE